MKIRLYIVAAPGGAKADFLAGWFGRLNAFVNNQWTIDIETGQSFTTANFLKQFSFLPEHARNLATFLASHQYYLHEDHDFLVSASTHDYRILRHVDQNVRHLVTTVYISVAPEHHLETAWNFFVKTMLTKHRCQHAVEKQITFGVDHYLNDLGLIPNDQERLAYLDRYLDAMPIPSFTDIPAQQCDLDLRWIFDYGTLFAPGGSRYLAEKMDLICDLKHHVLWDQNLEYSHSPLRIERFGKIFFFEEFRDRWQNQKIRHP